MSAVYFESMFLSETIDHQLMLNSVWQICCVRECVIIIIIRPAESVQLADRLIG